MEDDKKPAENKSIIVRNKSAADKYKYSSLADLAEAGVNIPKMRLKVIDGQDYIEYFDGTEWQLGARVVVPQSSFMNPAQAYGAALTYSRRYTVQMAERVACDDDDNIEKDKPQQNQKGKSANHADFNKIRAAVNKLETVDQLNVYWKSLGKMSDKQKNFLQKIFAKRKEEINGME